MSYKKNKNLWVFLSDSKKVGGIEIFTSDIKNALSLYYNIKIIYLHDSKLCFRSSCVSLHKNMFSFLKKYLLLILINKKDIVIFNQPGHIKYFQRNSDITFLVVHNPSEINKFQILNKLTKIKLLCVAKHIKNHLKEFSNDKFILTPPIYECNNIKIKESELDLNFLYVGRLEKPKCIFKIIDFVISLSSLLVNHKIKLTMVGDGSEKTNILSLINSKSNLSNLIIEIHDWKPRDTLCFYFSINSFYIQMSEIEGMPIALREAMNAGLIPFVSDIPAHRELIDNNENGFIVSELFDLHKLKFLLSDSNSLNKLRRNAINTVRTHTFLNFKSDLNEFIQI